MNDHTPAPAPEATAEKKPRRRLTPEQRIAEREAEIAAIKERQREAVRFRMVQAASMLHECGLAAKAAGMEADSQRCFDAFERFTSAKPEES